jgi:dCMP deaminase
VLHRRPSWDEYFMGMAQYASIRSHDSQTKVGCVIVGSPNVVVGIGYNGFCSGVKEDDLPTTRPDKYPFIVHAEANAISNLVIKQIDWYRAYITHLPCASCAKLLWQSGVMEWYVPVGSKAHGETEEDKIVYDHLIDNGLEITYLDSNIVYNILYNSKE